MSTATMTQTGRILKALKTRGRITNVELHRMGIFRYSARIHELRNEGHDILAVHIKHGLWEFVYRGEKDQ